MLYFFRKCKTRIIKTIDQFLDLHKCVNLTFQEIATGANGHWCASWASNPSAGSNKVRGRFNPYTLPPFFGKRRGYYLYDLVVSGQKGDVKYSTYFLEVSRSFPLRCAFYIVRAFDIIERRWKRLVLLKRWAWDEIDGETIFGTLEQVFGAQSVQVEIEIRGEHLVVINYEEWKQRIRQYQTERGK